MLDPKQSKVRAGRMAQRLTERGLDALVCGQPHHVYYFTAYLTRWTHNSAAVVFADGATCLIKPDKTTAVTAANDVIDYEADWMFTLRQEQAATVAARVADVLRKRKAT